MSWPWSRRRWTQPERRASLPASDARSSPHECVRYGLANRLVGMGRDGIEPWPPACPCFRGSARSARLLRRLRPTAEPAALRSLDASSAVATLDGTAGAGRIVHALTQAGIHCDDLVQAVISATIEPDELLGVSLGRRFDTVVLGSHLVNLPDEDRRRAFLDLAAPHLTDAGSLFVEPHPIDWAETAADVEPTPGSAVGMENVRRDPPFVSAVSVFDVGGRIERQRFSARVLSERDLAGVLAGAGFRLVRRVSPTLIEARPAV